MPCHQTQGSCCYTAILPSWNGWRSGSKAGRCGACRPTSRLPFKICLEEAVANIIMYSTTTDDRLEIIVEVEHRDQTLVARIEDNGSAFDPTRVPRPPVPASLAEAQVGNIGIHLMRSFASGMDYERRDSRNRLTMQFVEERDAAHGA